MTDRLVEEVASSPFVGLQGRPRSVVARQQSPWPMILAGGGIALLGVVVFASLSASRIEQSQPAQALASPAAGVNGAAPAILGTPGNVLMPPAVTQPPGLANGPGLAQLALNPGAGVSGALATVGGQGASRMSAPSLVIDLSGGDFGAALKAAGGDKEQAQGGQTDKNETGDEKFAARLARGTVETSTPIALRDRAMVAPQGTIIPAVMETAINSDLPGYVRALVSRDVRGFDGTTVLIPRGSHLIGQYRNAVAMGQSRAFVVWSRMLTPEGLSIDIQSPGTDRLGRAGLEGETHSHFFRRFGNAILLSVLNAGLQAAATHGGNNTSIVIGSSQQASNIASLALQKEIDIAPTVTVNQGAAINVFISRDLDFSQIFGK